jgi:uncharacterized membrane protein HdeD (DUF308 family)
MVSPHQTQPPASPQRRVVRGWVTVVLGLLALAAPLLIGDWALLFLFALAPMGVFIVVVGVIEIVRGAVQADRGR